MDDIIRIITVSALAIFIMVSFMILWDMREKSNADKPVQMKIAKSGEHVRWGLTEKIEHYGRWTARIVAIYMAFWVSVLIWEKVIPLIPSIFS